MGIEPNQSFQDCRPVCSRWGTQFHDRHNVIIAYHGACTAQKGVGPRSLGPACFGLTTVPEECAKVREAMPAIAAAGSGLFGLSWPTPLQLGLRPELEMLPQIIFAKSDDDLLFAVFPLNDGGRGGLGTQGDDFVNPVRVDPDIPLLILHILQGKPRFLLAAGMSARLRIHNNLHCRVSFRIP